VFLDCWKERFEGLHLNSLQHFNVLGVTILPCNEDVKSEDETAIALYRIGMMESSCAKHFGTLEDAYNNNKLEQRKKIKRYIID
jgi:hypothetical protein